MNVQEHINEHMPANLNQNAPISMNASVPIGTEIARPFLPAKDFDLSKRFYQELGFTMVLDSDEVAIFRIGTSSFILQKYFQKEWAENFMMQLMVDDLDSWWTHVLSLDLPAGFGVPAPNHRRSSPGACGSPTSSTPPVCFGTLRSADRIPRMTNRF